MALGLFLRDVGDRFVVGFEVDLWPCGSGSADSVEFFDVVENGGFANECDGDVRIAAEGGLIHVGNQSNVAFHDFHVLCSVEVDEFPSQAIESRVSVN